MAATGRSAAGNAQHAVDPPSCDAAKQHSAVGRTTRLSPTLASHGRVQVFAFGIEDEVHMGPAARRKSIPVRVGPVVVGGSAPIVVQSMTNTDTADVAA
ncbi:MAG: hypothetical protein ACM3Q0_00115, partial [Bacteroidota bacterium]